MLLKYQLIEAEWCIYASPTKAIIGSNNGLPPDWSQAIIWTNAVLLSVGPLGTNFSQIVLKIQTFSFMKMPLKMLSAKSSNFVSASMC